MSNSAATSVEEFIELLNAEQYVDIQKLRDYARHGVRPAVRGEVWLYLLGVLSDDKSQEMTSVRSKYIEYDSMEKHNVLYEKRIRREAARYYQRNLIPRPPPGRTMARSSQRMAWLDGKLISGGQVDGRGVNGSSSISKKAQNSNSGNPVMLRNASSRTITSNKNTLITAPKDTRGPNRADNGQTRVLAGIMGDSDPRRLNEREEVLIDPEAAAAHEMKRFCQAVENIVCAHLNRWKWIAEDGSVVVIEAEVDGEGAEQVPAEVERQAATQSAVEAIDVQHVQSTIRVGESKAGSTTPGGGSTYSSLPSEYEWAHQPLPDRKRSGLDKIEARRAGHLIQPEYHPDLILLCSPFVKCIRSEAGIFFAFEKLMSMIEKHNAQHPLPSRIATFLMLFRTQLPELYAYFDEEEVDVIGLASAWMRHLLAAEMRIEDLMRLWDTYFAVPDPLDLHMYVCIAILTNFNDALEELDQSEAKNMLFSLPPLDVDRVGLLLWSV
jgi:hypothetical protein